MAKGQNVSYNSTYQLRLPLKADELTYDFSLQVIFWSDKNRILAWFKVPITL